MASLQNTILDYELYDFGRPWLLKHNKTYVNFELSDHYFFALIIKSVMSSYAYNDIIFLGDGCGYLAQIFLKVCADQNILSVTMIDLLHFLCRQFLLLSPLQNKIKLNFLNAEIDNYSVSQTPKVFINQDSLPEINEEQQEKYFEYMLENNVKLFASYNKVDFSYGHENFRDRADKLFKQKLLTVESIIRPGYWVEIWVN